MCVCVCTGEAVAAVSDKSQSALPAPDVKRFQQSLAELTAQVKEKESQRVSLTYTSHN